MFFKKSTFLAITTMLVISIIFFAGCGEEMEGQKGEENGEEEVQNDVVAAVNDKEITREELDEVVEQNIEMMGGQMPDKEVDEAEREEMRQEIEPDALDQLIEDTLLVQKAEEKGISADESDIEAELEEIMATEGMDEEMLEKQLEQQGATMGELEEDIEKYFLIEELVREEVGEEEFEFSEEELKEMYAQQEAQMEMAEEKGMPTEKELDDFEDMKGDLNDMAGDQIIQENLGPIIEELKEDAEIEKHI